MLEQKLKLENGQYLDHEKKQSGILANYDIDEVIALMDCQVFCLRFSDYIKFRNNTSKEKETISSLVIDKLPGLKFCSSNRKKIIIDQFKEIEFEPNTLLEVEG